MWWFDVYFLEISYSGRQRSPSTDWSKGIQQVRETVSLMLRMGGPIFGSGKAIVLYIVFCVAKGITYLKDKGVYVADLINKRRYWPKGIPGDLLDTHFEDKDIGNVGMIEVRTEDDKLFKIFFMKEPGYVTKIMASWMTLDELEGARTRRYFIDIIGTNESK